MAILRYSAQCSIDGFIEDASGGFGWAEPDEEVHAWVNDAERDSPVQLLGRRMYEIMKVWQDSHEFEGDSPEMQDYGRLWRAAEKVVYSTTLDAVETPKTRLERTLDRHDVEAIKDAATGPVGIGGPGVAASAFRLGLVDEVRLLLWPIAVGSGKPALPTDQQLSLELVEHRRFTSGVALLHYRVLHP